MENSLKGLMIAAGVIITCLVISLGFYIAKVSSQTSNEAVEQIGQLQADFDQGALAEYDNAKISGSMVSNALQRFSGSDFGLLVKTKMNTSGSWYNKVLDVSKQYAETGTSPNTLAQISQRSSADYINPTAQFKCTLLLNGNGTPVGIDFEQQ